ncbi:uncharacterized protein ACWYII_007001 isoform 1-T1 [Salvelinus alpinus]
MDATVSQGSERKPLRPFLLCGTRVVHRVLSDWRWTRRYRPYSAVVDLKELSLRHCLFTFPPRHCLLTFPPRHHGSSPYTLLHHRLVGQLHRPQPQGSPEGRSAQRITGGKLPALQDTYTTRCHRMGKKIIKDNNHPSYCLFTPLSSRRRGPEP